MENVNFAVNNVWMMLCIALVFIMHLGFSLLEIGLTRAKNTINILFKNVMVIIIGILTYTLIVLSVSLLEKIKLDDPVGAVSVHLTCGVWGTLAVGLFGSMAGLGQLLSQVIGISAVGAFAALTSFVIFYLLKQAKELRVTEQEEIEGLDAHEHGTAAYAELKYE